MSSIPSRCGRIVALIAALAVLAACGLPQVGPNKRQIYAGSVEREGNAFVVTVDDRVTRLTSVVPPLGFSSSFLTARQVGSDTINPGDTLGVSVWENVDQPLLGAAGSAFSALEEIQVDGAGFIFIPYAGRIKASGNNPEAIRRIITEKLSKQTPDPQVQVRRISGDGASVTLLGAVGAQGVYPIEQPTRTLAAMLARGGGVTIEPEIAQVTVTRNGHQGTIWFADLYDNPALDIALRPGDRILVEEDTRAFIALGATRGQRQVRFERQDLSALEAIAQVGGLDGRAADPTGVFVFRDEQAEIANQILGRNDLTGKQRIVYVMDLTQPNGIFMARDFVIRDDDTLYVTEAPFTQWDKTISSLTGSANSLNALDRLAEN